MSVSRVAASQALIELGQYGSVIDVRSPSEFALDHLPGAVNWPVLDDEERRVVGTLYKQVSPLKARQVGAPMVARNIARHVERDVLERPREWRPLVYCWRGGQRSGAMAWFLDQIGYRTAQLDGGYKAFRSALRADLDERVAALRLTVVCGRTGSGKTRLLHALRDEGAQVLDLEALARHRGSVLGGLPAQPQPAQKRFDTLVWDQLRQFDPARPVFVESESRKIGALLVPETLSERMRSHGECVFVEMPAEARVRLLLDDYGHFARDVDAFCKQLEGLVTLRGRAVVKAWQAAARDGRWAELFAELMAQHYDPLYDRSMQRSFGGLRAPHRLTLANHEDATLAAAARSLLA
jgi:tRNA 2-selenouridine synthase